MSREPGYHLRVREGRIDYDRMTLIVHAEPKSDIVVTVGDVLDRNNLSLSADNLIRHGR
jgi:hypothetical protein